MTEITNEILTVSRYAREDDGEVCVRCPHCGWVIGLERGPFKGEQYQHKANPKCGGWLDVSHDASFVKTAEQLVESPLPDNAEMTATSAVDCPVR